MYCYAGCNMAVQGLFQMYFPCVVYLEMFILIQVGWLCFCIFIYTLDILEQKNFLVCYIFTFTAKVGLGLSERK